MTWRRWLIAALLAAGVLVAVGCKPARRKETKDRSRDFSVLRVQPSEGGLGGGGTIVIYGQGFKPGAAVYVGGRSATQVLVASRREIRAIVPPGLATGFHDVLVVQGGRTAVLGGAYRYLGSVLLSIFPLNGVLAGGTPVTVRGRFFSRATLIRIGGRDLVDQVFADDTTILGRTPAGALPGSVDVTAETAGTVSAISSGFFYFLSPVPIPDPVPAATSEHGFAIAAGDFDADGDDDVAVGAPRGNGNRGEVHVFFSDGQGAFPVVTTLVEPVTEIGARFGFSLAAGDFDSDGDDDLLVGAALSNAGFLDAGEAFVFFSNGAGGFPVVVTLVDPVPEGNARFGDAVAVGDVDGDGDDDVLVGARLSDVGVDANAGEVFLFRSNGAGGFLAAVTIAEPVVQTGAEFGASLATGRVNGDAFFDLVVGADRASAGAANSGEAHVLFSDGAGGFPVAVALADPTPELSANFGNSVDAGDVDADGDEDILVGVPFADPGGLANAGEAWVFRSNGAGGFAPGAQIQEPVPAAGAEFGTAVAWADVDGSTYADALVSAVGATVGGFAGAGRVQVFYASGSGGFLSTRTVTENVPEAGANFGGGLAGCDANADGFADLVAGAPGATNGGFAGAGEAFVYFGPNP